MENKLERQYRNTLGDNQHTKNVEEAIRIVKAANESQIKIIMEILKN